MFRQRSAAATRSDALTALQDRLDQLMAGRVSLRVLEAGCGARTPLTYPVAAHVVGIDKDEVALARNQRIDEPVIADLQTCVLARDHFDMIVGWYVFEHLTRPELVLKKLAEALRFGGLMVVAVPNIWSPKALVAKYTP